MAATDDFSFFSVCPKCGYLGEFCAETKFGYISSRAYRLGDRVIWIDDVSADAGGRPADGNLDLPMHGFSACPQCDQEYLVDVKILADTIVFARLADLVVYA
jgi:hypothetical protein